MTKRLTFKQARENLLDYFERHDYEVKRNLKVPWARKDNRKYYFKTQSLYRTDFNGSLKTAHSYCSDIRTLSSAQNCTAKVIL